MSMVHPDLIAVLATFEEPYVLIANSAMQLLVGGGGHSSRDTRPVPARVLNDTYVRRSEMLDQDLASDESERARQEKKFAADVARELARLTKLHINENWLMFTISLANDEFWVFADERGQGRFIVRWPASPS